MAIHFISVLGTGLYEPIQYELQDYNSGEQQYIQAVLIKRYKDQLSENGKISIFLTSEARKRNWENRIYEKWEESAAQRWNSASKADVIEGNEKRGLKYLLEQEFGTNGRIKGISIEDASTQNKIWSVFQAIYSEIEEGDEIIFDITHGFRSIPMLAIIILNYARVTKGCQIGGIYYGAYEAARDHNGIAPIVDLTVYNEILQWTSATEAFIQYGNADQIQMVYKEKMKNISNDEKKNWSGVSKTVAAMKNLADTIATCRGVNADRLSNVGKEKNKTKEKKSIKCAYQGFKREVEKDWSKQTKEIIPLHRLLGQAKENYSQFDQEKDYEIGLEVVKWSIQNNMTQQGYTALEETVKTFLCDIYGMDNTLEKNRDGVIGTMMNVIYYFNEKKGFKIKEEEQYQPEIRQNMKKYANNYMKSRYRETDEDEDERELSKYSEIVATLPIEIAMLGHEIKNGRNDINHFGFNMSPASAEGLKKNLESYLNRFENFLQEKLEKFKKLVENYRELEKIRKIGIISLRVGKLSYII